MKKIICAVLAMQLLTVTVFAGSIPLNDSQKEDLHKLEIMVGDENGDLRLDDTVTRAEAVKMICTAGDINPGYNTEEKSIFNDVSVKHWAYKYIYAANERGIAAGDENGNFNPEDNVTNEEFVKMLVCLLGYGEYAKVQGGYPAGYTAVATELGITASMNLNNKSHAVRNDAAVMICNSLDLPIVVKKSDVAYVILNGENTDYYSTLRGTRGKNWDTSRDHINELTQSFAAQYPYKESDEEKTFDLYPDIVYTSGIEKTKDGISYECPAIYDDNMVQGDVSNIKKGNAKLAYGNSIYDVKYLVFKSKVLVPYNTFRLIGCETVFDTKRCVAEIKKNDTVIEILPNIIGMRKNRADGYWVPLEVCARFSGDMLYVPLEAVAKEFNCEVSVDLEAETIYLK